ncbi:hypothetical protein EDB19DRAFT_2029391 [Suillus lakei]|nr:hypothetical protein EDB19DRAFT_2029391 [Suillus lakei]
MSRKEQVFKVQDSGTANPTLSGHAQLLAAEPDFADHRYGILHVPGIAKGQETARDDGSLFENGVHESWPRKTLSVHEVLQIHHPVEAEQESRESRETGGIDHHRSCMCGGGTMFIGPRASLSMFVSLTNHWILHQDMLWSQSQDVRINAMERHAPNRTGSVFAKIKPVPRLYEQLSGGWSGQFLVVPSAGEGSINLNQLELNSLSAEATQKLPVLKRSHTPGNLDITCTIVDGPGFCVSERRRSRAHSPNITVTSRQLASNSLSSVIHELYADSAMTDAERGGAHEARDVEDEKEQGD